MRIWLLASVLVLLALGSMGWRLASSFACTGGDSRSAPPSLQAPPRFGTAVPPASEPTWLAAQVLVVSPSLAAPSPLFLNRASYNRLRREAGISELHDKPGLAFSVKIGAAAQAWGLEPGSVAELIQLESAIEAPQSIIAGDDWFAAGLAVTSLPDVQSDPTP